MRVAIDMTSGDNSAVELLPGALQAARESEAKLLLVGDRAELERGLSGQSMQDVELIHADE